jgi:Raf kinase inhibitor-like YbhB/YbcL family protein
VWRLAHATAVGLLLTAAACSGGGSKPATPGTPVTRTVVPGTALKLSSPAFADNAPVPRQYTCDGADRSPALAWSGVPEGATELRLTVKDVDAPGGTLVHWTVARIQPADGSSGDGQVPAGGVQGPNSFGSTAYRGPCPPPGRPHRYVFTLDALEDSSVAATGTLTATYAR